MLIYEDLLSRKGYGFVRDFCEIAHGMELLDRDQKPVRELFVTTAACSDLDEWPAKLRNAAYAELLNFLSGERLLWGDFRQGNHLKPLDPSYRWVEFKIRTGPQVRIYGAFLAQDFFIALSCNYRSASPSSEELGRKWISFWGEDAYKMPTDSPDELMTNYMVAK